MFLCLYILFLCANLKIGRICYLNFQFTFMNDETTLPTEETTEPVVETPETETPEENPVA